MIFSFRIILRYFYVGCDRQENFGYSTIRYHTRRCGHRQKSDCRRRPAGAASRKWKMPGLSVARRPASGKTECRRYRIVSIKTDKHDAAWYEGFSSAVNDFPEVVEFYRMSGDIDYLPAVVPDIAAYDRFASG